MSIDSTLIGSLLKTIDSFPDKCAIKSSGSSISYRELGEQVERLSSAITNHGFVSDQPIIIVMKQSIEAIVTLLGISRSCNYYVPVNYRSPDERIVGIVEQLDAKLIITDRDFEDERLQSKAIKYTDICSTEVDGDVSGPLPGPDSIAYCIFTSGTTDNPKAVLCTHANVLSLFNSVKDEFNFSEDDHWTLYHSISFGFSVWEIFGSLLNAATLHVLSDELTLDQNKLIDYLNEQAISVFSLTPSVFAVFEKASATNKIDTKLKHIFLSGEATNAGAIDSFIDRYPALSIVNQYALTETSGAVSYTYLNKKTLSEFGHHVIGKAILNTQIHLLDADLKPVEQGAPGEICVSGPGIAQGYLNNSALNSTKFISSPYIPDKRLYRTGDMGIEKAPGIFIFNGRNDNQIKLRGFRIELDEIKSHLLSHPAVQDAEVIPLKNLRGEIELAAYIIEESTRSDSGSINIEKSSTDLSNNSGEDSLLNVSQVEGHLARKVPDYMIPQHIVFINEFPLNQNGKLDKSQLPAPEIQKREIINPTSHMEISILSTWKGILGQKEISLDDDFFKIGGDSLSMSQLHLSLDNKSKFGITLPELLDNTTIRSQAILLHNKKLSALGENDTLRAIRTEGSKPPLFLIHGARGFMIIADDFLDIVDDDQPIYCFNARGFKENEKPHNNFHDMAVDYLKAIESTVDVKGPYCFMSFCAGSMVAVEMADILMKAGKKVAPMIFIDPTNMTVRKVDNARRKKIIKTRALIDELEAKYALFVANQESSPFLKEPLIVGEEIMSSEFDYNLLLCKSYFRHSDTCFVPRKIKAKVIVLLREGKPEVPAWPKMFKSYRELVVRGVISHEDIFDFSSPLMKEAIQKGLRFVYKAL
ncbi:MAG: amino acid adenylation domain-containing protein [Lentisphaeria bacterium]|nr:amino acid adenylation domain-containing protein [Lentisphaeria bacterium]NQZ67540.1 amino acid adenylation domain-containing protein [Lentisphaeria bacterium]